MKTHVSFFLKLNIKKENQNPEKHDVFSSPLPLLPVRTHLRQSSSPIYVDKPPPPSILLFPAAHELAPPLATGRQADVAGWGSLARVEVRPADSRAKGRGRRRGWGERDESGRNRREGKKKKRKRMKRKNKKIKKIKDNKDFI